jgi:hypothetical protein
MHTPIDLAITAVARNLLGFTVLIERVQLLLSGSMHVGLPSDSRRTRRTSSAARSDPMPQLRVSLVSASVERRTACLMPML